MFRTVACDKCGLLHYEVSEHIAIYEISRNNKNFYQSEPEIQQTFNLEPIYIEDFLYCRNCYNSYENFTSVENMVDYLNDYMLYMILDKNSKSDLSSMRYLDNAHAYIIKYCMQFGRLGGTFTSIHDLPFFEPKFENLNLHNLIYPSQSHNQFIDLLAKVDTLYIEPLLKPLQRYFHAYQRNVYIKAYKHCIDLFPHIKHEILACSAYPELLRHLED